MLLEIDLGLKYVIERATKIEYIREVKVAKITKFSGEKLPEIFKGKPEDYRIYNLYPCITELNSGLIIAKKGEMFSGQSFEIFSVSEPLMQSQSFFAIGSDNKSGQSVRHEVFFSGVLRI